MTTMYEEHLLWKAALKGRNGMPPRSKSRSLLQFIHDHRAEIDQAIDSVTYRHNWRSRRGIIPNPPPKHNDEERRGWVLNDEGLYNWARSEGVKI